ncbi:hypothetical protein DSO57_1021588 [Entomophthora muscae]|uniref:Uncharacterized protein n=1 Tax=Entomophthora muscae TaxID=34485 RepID=A0ACC2TER0_9FUNG|nr:hypothetical protein DSO57_1021588 [Entomophthora muscae]
MEWYVFLGNGLLMIGTLAVVMNCILILVSLRIGVRKVDVDLAVVLAAVDIALTSITLCTTAVLLVSGRDLSSLDRICLVKGPVDFLGLFVSALLVMLIAIKRYMCAFDKRVPKVLVLGMLGYSLGYVTLVAVTVVRGEFSKSPSGIDCAPNALASASAASLVFMLGFSLLVFLLVTLACYLRICVLLMFQLEQKPSSVFRRIRLAVRPIAITSTYFVLIAPSSVLIMMESFGTSVDVAEKASIVISVCLYSVSLANPCLVLFAHTLFYDRLWACVRNSCICSTFR